jgi:hypothetical protein
LLFEHFKQRLQPKTHGARAETNVGVGGKAQLDFGVEARVFEFVQVSDASELPDLRSFLERDL